jgi:hypothetical protein
VQTETSVEIRSVFVLLAQCLCNGVHPERF